MAAGDVKIELVFNHLPSISPAVARKLAAQVERSAKAIEEDVHQEMRGPKTGRVYLIGGKVHQASAPGEAPAVLTGHLIRSVKAYKQDELTWNVPSDGIQSWWEFGLRGYAERPYFRPAVEKERDAFERGCEEAVKEAEHAA